MLVCTRWSRRSDVQSRACTRRAVESGHADALHPRWAHEIGRAESAQHAHIRAIAFVPMKMVNFRFRIITEASSGSPKRCLGPGSFRSGRPHRAQELADLELEAVGIARQRLRRRQHLR